MGHPDAQACVKSAYVNGGSVFVAKVAAGGGGLNSGLVLVFSQTTFAPRAVFLDGGFLTELRTAAAGALSAQHFAPADLSTIAVIGCGVQARWQLRLLASVVSCRRVLCWARRPEQMHALVAELRRDGWASEAAPSLEAACSGLADPSTPRDECWFVLSERSIADIDAAVDACARSGLFQLDCARHLYDAVPPARQETALTLLRERLPDHAASFANGSAWRRAEDANRARAAAIAQDIAEDAEMARQLELARSTRPQALGLSQRWRRRARHEAEVRAVLCAGTLDEVRTAAARWPDLFWSSTDVNDRAVQDARTRACQAAAP